MLRSCCFLGYHGSSHAVRQSVCIRLRSSVKASLCARVLDLKRARLLLLQRWTNHRISWDPDDFCGITRVSVPQDILWKPDIFIYEM